MGDDVLNLNPVAWVKDHAGTITLLSSLLPAGSGVTLEQATGINDAGQICATGIKDGQEHAFRLTPVPATPPQAQLTSRADHHRLRRNDLLVRRHLHRRRRHRLHHARQCDPGDRPRQLLTNRRLSRTTSGNPKNLTATYTINAPGGTWDFADDGTYNVTLKNNVVKSTSGKAIARRDAGAFRRGGRTRARVDLRHRVQRPQRQRHARRGRRGRAERDVFLDLNANGSFDAGDRLTQTDANGAYTFGGLLPGSYRVMELVIPAHAVTAPPNDLHFVTVIPGQN